MLQIECTGLRLPTVCLSDTVLVSFGQHVSSGRDPNFLAQLYFVGMVGCLCWVPILSRVSFYTRPNRHGVCTGDDDDVDDVDNDDDGDGDGADDR